MITYRGKCCSHRPVAGVTRDKLNPRQPTGPRLHWWRGKLTVPTRFRYLAAQMTAAEIYGATMSVVARTLGGALVPRAGERVLVIANFPPSTCLSAAGGRQRKDCFGATP